MAAKAALESIAQTGTSEEIAAAQALVDYAETSFETARSEKSAAVNEASDATQQAVIAANEEADNAEAAVLEAKEVLEC